MNTTRPRDVRDWLAKLSAERQEQAERLAEDAVGHQEDMLGE
jgi:hypothetical protein